MNAVPEDHAAGSAFNRLLRADRRSQRPPPEGAAGVVLAGVADDDRRQQQHRRAPAGGGVDRHEHPERQPDVRRSDGADARLVDGAAEEQNLDRDPRQDQQQDHRRVDRQADRRKPAGGHDDGDEDPLADAGGRSRDTHVFMGGKGRDRAGKYPQAEHGEKQDGRKGGGSEGSPADDARHFAAMTAGDAMPP
jgi:hypothetical protein